MAHQAEAGHTTFTELLADHRYLVADGAMGTTLFSLGLEGGGCPELLNIEEGDLVEKVHRGFIDAGADIILTNTFGGNRLRLDLHDLGDRVAELNRAGVEAARRAADLADRPVAVAGSVGPTGELFEPLGTLSHERGVEVFGEQCEALAEAGADVIWIETISSFEELKAAVEAASRTGLPIAATLSFDTAGHTMMGIHPRDLGQWWLGHQEVTAIGANCGIGPGDAVAAAHAIGEVAPTVADDHQGELRDTPVSSRRRPHLPDRPRGDGRLRRVGLAIGCQNRRGVLRLDPRPHRGHPGGSRQPYRRRLARPSKRSGTGWMPPWRRARSGPGGKAVAASRPGRDIASRLRSSRHRARPACH